TLNNTTSETLAQGQIVHDILTYTISDGVGIGANGRDSAHVDITIIGTNDPPIANNDANALLESITPDPAADLSGNVLANDRDVDTGDVLSVTTLAPMVGQYGTLVLQANGSYAYTLNDTTSEALSAGQVVHDVFAYSIADNHGATASAN